MLLCVALILCISACKSKSTLAKYDCNIRKFPLSKIPTNHEDFPNYPVVYEDEAQSNVHLNDKVSRSNLISNHADLQVKLSSSNTYSHGLKIMSLEDYITTWVDVPVEKESNIHGSANESFYLFGNNYDGIFSEVSKEYKVPPCKHCEKGGAKTIGIGGPQSGVSFHFHGFGFSEPLIGDKQWFLFPSELTPLVSKFSPNMTVSQWAKEVKPFLNLLRDSSSVGSNAENSTGNISTGSYSSHSSTTSAASISADTNSVCDNTEENSSDNSNNSNGCNSDKPGKTPQSLNFLSATLSTDLPHLSTTLPNTQISTLTNTISPTVFNLMTLPEWQQLANNFYECVIKPGEILYFPHYWMHATLNLADYNVFYSVFLDPQLMRD